MVEHLFAKPSQENASQSMDLVLQITITNMGVCLPLQDFDVGKGLFIIKLYFICYLKCENCSFSFELMGRLKSIKLFYIPRFSKEQLSCQELLVSYIIIK